MRYVRKSTNRQAGNEGGREGEDKTGRHLMSVCLSLLCLSFVVYAFVAE